MKKFLLSLIALVMLCATNVWGAVSADYNSTTKVLTISGTGAMTSSLTTTSTWTSTYKSNVKEVTIAEGVTAINSEAFKGFGKLATVSLPSSLTSIGTDAFDGTVVANLTYAGSPSEWAQINIANNKAHPYYGTAASRKFYFYGSGTATTNLVLSPTITTVKQFAFYNASFSNIYIPGTVETIEKRAFYCSIAEGGVLVINHRDAAPSIVTTSGETSFMNQSRTLYYPTGATGYDAVGSNYTKTGKAISGTMTAPKGADITWDLSEDGILTLNATGATKTISFSSYTDLPWSVYRRLVDKVVLQGGIEEVTETFTYCFGLNEIEIDQSKIPTVTPTGANVAIAFTSRFDQRKNVKMYIKSASLADASASNLAAEPWSNAKLDIELSDNVVFADNVDNSALVSNLNSYVEKPFTLQLGRSMSNTTEYYTFCSPIDLSASQVATIFGAEAKLHTMTGSSYDEGTNELELNFDDCSTIVAGKPYIVMPSQAVSNPTIENVDPSAVTATADKIEATNVTFYGTLAPRAVDEDEIAGGKMIILIGNSELTWANGGTVGGMRAYWLLDQSAPTGVRKAKPVMRIGKTATAIEEVRSENAYAVRSEKVLRDGQIYILRDNKMYNMQGQLVK